MNDTDKTAIYAAIRELVLAYAPPYKVDEGKNVSGKDSVALLAEGDFTVNGKKRTEVYFAGVIMQKAYVGFYFMPIYSDETALRKVFSPQLLACLKGKSCFYIKKNDTALMQDIKSALAAGFTIYKQRGWV